MIKLLKARVALVRGLRDDSGISIIEVLVAALIFALISVGVAQATVTAARLAGDGQHRTVALNLAASELDRLRALDDPYSISSGTIPPVTVDGVTYNGRRSASWVNVNGNEISCAAASGNFQLMRVRVSYDWNGRLPSTNQVVNVTTISPQNTILSPTTATLFISVTKSDGTPYVGITPKVVSPTGANLSVPATNNDGCSYLSGIGAGNYTVTLTNSNGISVDQKTIAAATPTPTVVTPGSAVAIPFSYDVKATIGMSYATDIPNAILPSDLVTSFSSSTATSAYLVNGTPGSVDLFPVASGYAVVAGKLVAAAAGYSGCLSPDPQNWPAATVGGTPLATGVRLPNESANPGGTDNYALPMGGARVTTIVGGWVRVQSAASSVAGDPGCAAVSGSPAQTYTYRVPAGTSTLAIPFGSWTSSFSVTSPTAGFFSVAATPTTNVVGSTPSSTFTLDPRKAS